MELYPITSVAASQYTDALVTNAVEAENLVLASALQGVNGNAQNILYGVTINSVENLAWEVQFWAKDTFQTTNPDTDFFLARWQFSASDGVRDAGTGLYRYYIDGLQIPYQDLDNTGELHMILVNRSAAAKTAGAGGAVRIIIWAGPMQVGQ